MACIEFAKISHDSRSRYGITLITDIAACLLLCFSPEWPFLGFLWLLTILIRFIEQLYIREDNPVRDLAHSILVQAWIAMPMFLMVLIADLWQPELILAVFLFLWINDTGAYLVGIKRLN